jgi:hypothetical protein
MSAALSSARKRRAPAEVNPSPRPGVPSTPAPNGMQSAGLTLPQVISLVDKRLTLLETGYKELSSLPSASSPEESGIPSNISEVLEEYGSRFDIIADELANLKNTLLSLQTYTMEVNKKLMDDRIRILSDSPLEESLNNAN